MPQRRLIIHVGAPKCGSSSIQAALSRRPDFRSRDGEEFRYAAITSDGTIMAGETLRRRATTSIFEYVASENTPTLEQLGADRIGQIADDLNRLLGDASVVLSCEGWFERVGDFTKLELLKKIAARVEIIGYFRPQPDYINAAWWQWAVWSNIELDDWLSQQNMMVCSWGTMSYFWALIEGVDFVYCRLKTNDVVSDFFGFLGCDEPGTRFINRALPAAALRLMQRNRSLRPGAHNSAIDFTLSRALHKWSGRSPWVLPMTFVRRVVEECREDNLSLVTALPPAHAEAMKADPRWWDASAYADRPIEEVGPPPPDAAEADTIATALAHALRDAEFQLGDLRYKLALAEASASG